MAAENPHLYNCKTFYPANRRTTVGFNCALSSHMIQEALAGRTTTSRS
jgi:hypothetical protein